MPGNSRRRTHSSFRTHHRRGAGVGVVRRRFKADEIAFQHDNTPTGGGPVPSTMTPAQTEVATNGHGAPTLVEHVGDDIIVWPAADAAWTSNGSSAVTAVPVTTESGDVDEPDGRPLRRGVAIRQPPLHSRRAEATAPLGDRFGHRGPRGRRPPVARVGTDAARRDEGPAHVSQHERSHARDGDGCSAARNRCGRSPSRELTPSPANRPRHLPPRTAAPA